MSTIMFAEYAKFVNDEYTCDISKKNIEMLENLL